MARTIAATAKSQIAASLERSGIAPRVRDRLEAVEILIT